MSSVDEASAQLQEDEEQQTSAMTSGEKTYVGILATLPILLSAPAFMLSHPYWYDESWVVVATRAPWSKVLLASSSTPIGWTLLMSAVPGAGEQRQRLLPLAFAIGSVILAYMFARDLEWRTPATARAAGTVTALFVALAPVALVRQDLKQYTADACLALLIAWLVLRLERSWTTKRLWTLVGICAVSALVSSASMFVAGAAMVALAIVWAVRGNWRRFAEVVVAGSAMAISFLIVAMAFVLPNVGDRLADFWEQDYLHLDGGIWKLGGEIVRRFSDIAPLLGFTWPLLTAVLTVVGIVAVACRKGSAAAVMLPVLYLEMIALGVLHKYPFLEQRTSHFVLILTIVFAAVGVAIVGATIYERLPNKAVASGILICAAAFFFFGSSPYIGSRAIPVEDVRTQTQYVEEHFESGDVILINALGSYGFAYYWHMDDPLFTRSDAFANGFAVGFDRDDIFIASTRSNSGISEALDAAMAAASQPDASGRVWLIRSHIVKSEKEIWETVLQDADISLDTIGEGRERLTMLNVSPGGES